MSDQTPITIPPVDVLRAELTAKQAEVRPAQTVALGKGRRFIRRRFRAD